MERAQFCGRVDLAFDVVDGWRANIRLAARLLCERGQVLQHGGRCAIAFKQRAKSIAEISSVYHQRFIKRHTRIERHIIRSDTQTG